MKNKDFPLRLTVISLFLSIISISLFADRVVYTYDASGNMTQSQRQIRLRDAGNGSDQDTVPMCETLSFHNITIYPNPTKGRFSVEITGTEIPENSSITLHNLQGGIIYSNNAPDQLNEIDLTPQPDGLYILTIKIDSETSTWKVIKN